MKLEFSRQILEKYSNIKFHEILSSRGRVVACERTDRPDEANNSLYSLANARLKTDLNRSSV
jgi:hypothetical protein